MYYNTKEVVEKLKQGIIPRVEPHQTKKKIKIKKKDIARAIVFDIYKKGLEPKFTNMNDLHCWIELPNGKILDYSLEKLKKTSMCASNLLRYEPFDEETQLKCLVYWFKKYNDEVLSGKLAKQNGCSQDKLFQTMLIQTGFCQYRSIYLFDKMKDCKNPPKIVFGSLGFIQDNGDIFYEYG